MEPSAREVLTGVWLPGWLEFVDDLVPGDLESLHRRLGVVRSLLPEDVIDGFHRVAAELVAMSVPAPVHASLERDGHGAQALLRPAAAAIVVALGDTVGAHPAEGVEVAGAAHRHGRMVLARTTDAWDDLEDDKAAAG